MIPSGIRSLVEPGLLVLAVAGILIATGCDSAFTLQVINDSDRTYDVTFTSDQPHWPEIGEVVSGSGFDIEELDPGQTAYAGGPTFGDEFVVLVRDSTTNIIVANVGFSKTILEGQDWTTAISELLASAGSQ